MKFISTRGQCAPVGFSRAVALGLAPDGGLFLPVTLPDISGRLAGWQSLAYPALCAEFIALFATDMPPAVVARLARESYANFAPSEIAPLRRLDERTAVLELFHGPTLAFKDFALQFLGGLYGWQCAQQGKAINVLGATSGDTGAAAIHGLLGHPRTAIFILYPDGRVSPLQERQMACTGAANVHALAVDGSFDDAQRVLKEVFGDRGFSAQHKLSAVNSINLARILAQSVYYLWAWLSLAPAERERAEFVVPTGNFGNVFSGWLLTRMGVPIPGFKVATNQNDILHRFFSTGEYRAGAVQPSLAPSMDIQAASNFERLLYYALGEDSAKLTQAMDRIKMAGAFLADGVSFRNFRSSRATDAEIPAIIREVHARHGHVVDPHTACAFKELDPARYSVVLATAHPAKFPEAIRAATGREATHPALEALKSRPVVKHRLPADAAIIRAYIEKHRA
jgi:threonine synthase